MRSRPLVVVLVALALAAVLGALAVDQIRDHDGSAPASSNGAAVALAPNFKPTSAERSCGKAVIADWYPDARIDKRYAAACYGAALGLLPPDPPIGSTVVHDVKSAYAAERAGLDPSGNGTGGSTPRWVTQAAVAEGDKLSSQPVRIEFASHGTSGWGVVMAGDFACRGSAHDCRFIGLRLSEPTKPAFAIGSCERYASCVHNVSLDSPISHLSACAKALVADWYADGHVDAAFSRSCHASVKAAPLH